jgi:hypothetical protein
MAKKGKKKRTKLDFACSTTACSDGLHYFGGRRGEGDKPQGTCHDCGERLVNFARTQGRNIEDVEYTVESLKKEWIRHKYWHHQEIKIRAINKARRKGVQGTEAAAERLLTRSVGPAFPYRDGHQVPYESNDIVHYAQHATAACCRKCIEYWHGIEPGREMTSEEISYLVKLVMNYVSYKLPNLTQTGEYVPSVPRDKDNDDS